MRFIFLSLFFISAGFLGSYFSSKEVKTSSNRCTLTLLSYRSVIKSLAKPLNQSFIKKFNCELEFQTLSGGRELLKTYLKNPEKISIMIGLDAISISEIPNLSPSKNIFFSGWSPMTILTKKNYPHEFTDLKNFFSSLKPKQLSFSNPRFSLASLPLLEWLNENSVPFSEALSIRPRVSPGWSGAYQHFQGDRSPYVFTFLSSLLYHYKVEKNFDIIPVKWTDPNSLPLYIEFGFVHEKILKEKLLQPEKILNFFKSSEIQNLFLKYNYLFPSHYGPKEIKKELENTEIFIGKLKPYDQKDIIERGDQLRKLLRTWRNL